MRRKRRRRRVVLTCFALLAVGFPMVFSGCFEKLAFLPHSGAPSPTPGEVGFEPWRSVSFPSRDGLKLTGWLIEGKRPPGRKAEAVVVHAHGNAGNMGCQFIAALGFCREAGCDILMFDYRGFGLSEPGRLTRFTVVEDLAGALAFARSTYPEAAVLLLGQSIGGATSALAMRDESLRRLVDGLCLISAFADWNVEYCDVLKSNPITWLLAYPVAYLLISPWRTEPYEGLVEWPEEKPLLLIHGEADRVVPVHHLDVFLRALGPEARKNVQVVRLPEGHHNSLGETPREGKETVRKAVLEWINRSTASSGG